MGQEQKRSLRTEVGDELQYCEIRISIEFFVNLCLDETIFGGVEASSVEALSVGALNVEALKR